MGIKLNNADKDREYNDNFTIPPQSHRQKVKVKIVM